MVQHPVLRPSLGPDQRGVTPCRDEVPRDAAGLISSCQLSMLPSPSCSLSPGVSGLHTRATLSSGSRRCGESTATTLPYVDCARRGLGRGGRGPLSRADFLTGHLLGACWVPAATHPEPVWASRCRQSEGPQGSRGCHVPAESRRAAVQLSREPAWAGRWAGCPQGRCPQGSGRTRGAVRPSEHRDLTPGSARRWT